MNAGRGDAQDELLDELLGDFLDESAQLMDRLNENLLRLDEWVRALDDSPAHCDAELMNDMFRAAHSIKGLSAMLGLREINHLTHKIENIFDAARNGQLGFTPYSVELLFQAHDLLSQLIGQLTQTDAPPPESEPILDRIQELLDSTAASKAQVSQSDAEQVLAAIAAGCKPRSGAPRPPAADASSNQDASAPGAAPASQPQPDARPPRPELAELGCPDYFAEVIDEGGVPSKYLAIFIDETELSLDTISETMLAIENGGRPAEVEKLLVVSHRIKGSAASVGLKRAAKLAHYMEDVLQNLRETGRGLAPRLVDALFSCVDALRRFVEGLKTGTPLTGDFNRLVHELLTAHRDANALAEPAAEPETQSACAEGPDTAQPALSAELIEKLTEQLPGWDGVAGTIRFQPGLALVGLKAELALERLRQCGQLFFCDPPAESCADRDDLTTLVFGLAGNIRPDDLRAQLRVRGIASLALVPLKRPADAPLAQARKPCAAGPSAPATGLTAGVPGNTTTQTNNLGSAGGGESIPKNQEAFKDPPSSKAADTKPGGGKPADTKPADTKPNESKPTETLRVDIERLDQLMNLAGQLVINKARLAQIGAGLRQVTSTKQLNQALNSTLEGLKRITDAAESAHRTKDAAAELQSIAGHARRMQAALELFATEVQQLSKMRAYVHGLGEAVHQLDRVTDGMQKSVMDTRMVPIGPLFHRFRRVVRDITQSRGKEIKLEIKGEKTELDKRMIDELGDPLIHMVRNSADHGIESPEERLAAGKPRQGTITLDAFHRGNSILIQVSDDGRGLNLDKIRRKALDKGLVSLADLDRMSPQQLYQLIWEPGFSTAELVTEISGRGMGMDIVRSKIEELSGTVELESAPGIGTTFTIKLPLTLAILPSLLAEIGGEVYALPVESVIEIVRVPPDQQFAVHGQRTALVRDRIISVVELSEVVHWSTPAAPGSSSPGTEITLVVIGEDRHEIGLVVDRLLGEEDVVIKSIADNYRHVAGIAGASILGDGRVSLILDVGALVDMSSRMCGTAARH
jgi:two-component system chemotaxis sensor kinase CheA